MRVTTARFTPSPRTNAARLPAIRRHQRLNNGTSAVDVALSAGQSISDLLIQMKQKALSAADTSLDTASRQAMNADFAALRDQITTIVNNAVFNGFNLVNGSTNQIRALASSDGSRHITTAAQNMWLSGGIVTIKSTASISTQSKASAWSRPSRPRSPTSIRLWPNCRRVPRSSRSRRPLPRSCPTP